MGVFGKQDRRVGICKRAELLSFLEGPRIVLPYRDDDARPSIVEAFGPRYIEDGHPSIIEALEPHYITVFSGKVDHCITVAEDIRNMIAGDVPKETEL